LLINKFKAQGINAQVQIVATTGFTTGDLIKAVQEENLPPSFDLVSLLIGVNNQYRGLSIENFQQEFEYLLKFAINLAKNDPKNVFIVSIPDYSVTPFARNKNPQKIIEDIKGFNTISRKIAGNYGVSFFDITPISQKAAHEPSLLAEDQLHPSGKMYMEWVDLIAPSLLKNFSFTG
jgi:acyl-CoA thioesterase I